MINTRAQKLIVSLLFFLSLRSIAGIVPSPNSAKLSFRENKGQVCDQNNQPRPDVWFSGSDGSLVFHLKNNGVSYQLTKVVSWSKSPKGLKKHLGKQEECSLNPQQLKIYRIDIHWINANPMVDVEKGKNMDGYENFYLASCPKGATQVKSYSSITYKNLYTGIDVRWYEKNGKLKYDYELAAGSEYKQIRLEINGANKIRINNSGQLVIETPVGNLLEEAPLVKQGDKILPSTWQVNGNRVSFRIEGIDHHKAFTIDPVVRIWGTYYGGNLIDYYQYTCIDATNNVIICGSTNSPNSANIATNGAYQTTYGGGNSTIIGDAFMAKFNSAGVKLWSTYYGGSGNDVATCCSSDLNSNIYIVGQTTSTNVNVMASAASHQSVMAIGQPTAGDAFVAKFNASGIRQWGTYYGDTDDDWAWGVCVDVGGNVIVCGTTHGQGTVLATPGSFQSAHSTSATSNPDAFLAKFSAGGVRQWGTYFGGDQQDEGIALVTDANANIYFCGETQTNTYSIIATPAAHQTTLGSIGGDAFFSKFSANGSRLWSSYYGGAGDDFIDKVLLDKNGDLYFSGATNSSNGTSIATPLTHQVVYGGGSADCFLAKFTTSGSRIWSTYYGGGGTDQWGYCTADALGNLYLAGFTSTTAGTAIATACAYQSTYGGGPYDAFLAKFTSNGVRNWGTYFGGSGNEGFNSFVTVEADLSNYVYLAGNTTILTNSAVISSPGASQSAYAGGNGDVFLEKFDGCIPTIPSGTVQVCRGANALVAAPPLCNLKWFSDSLANNFLFQGATYTCNPLTQDTIFWAKDVSCGIASLAGKITVHTMASPTLSINASATVLCLGETFTLTANGASTYTWATVTSTNQSVILTATNSMVHGVDGSLVNGCKGSKTIFIQVDYCQALSDNALIDDGFLKVIPNPNSGNFTLRTASRGQVSIYGQTGQLIQHVNLNENNRFSIDMTNFPEGAYVLVLNSDDACAVRKMVILK